MSITFNILYKGKGDSARRFAEEMVGSGLVAKIRAQEGNLRYEYYFPLSDGESVLLVDEWSDREALDRHHASQMMREIAEKRDKYGLHMTVRKYVSAPLDDEDRANIIPDSL